MRNLVIALALCAIGAQAAQLCVLLSPTNQCVANCAAIGGTISTAGINLCTDQLASQCCIVPQTCTYIRTADIKPIGDGDFNTANSVAACEAACTAIPTCIATYFRGACFLSTQTGTEPDPGATHSLKSCSNGASTTPEPTTSPEPTTPEPSTAEPTTQEPTTPTNAPIIEQCGVQRADDNQFRILNGVDAVPCTWPWQISIRGKVGSATAAEAPTQTNTVHTCAGVFLSESWVVTTAFCLIKINLAFANSDVRNNMLLFSGEYNLATNDFSEQQHRVSEAIINPNYFDVDVTTVDIANAFSAADNMKYANNIALLKLATPATFNDCIRKVCKPNATLPDGTCAGPKKTECKVAGWGQLTSTSTGASQILQVIDVDYLDSATVEAGSAINGATRPALTSVATFDNSTVGGDVCDGDNGGMVVCKNPEGRWELNGIINRPTIAAGCVSSTSFVTTDIQEALPWIETVIAANP